MTKQTDREVVTILRILKAVEDLPDQDATRRVMIYVLLRLDLQHLVSVRMPDSSLIHFPAPTETRP